MYKRLGILVGIFYCALAAAHDQSSAFLCDDMSVFDYSSGMCMPRAMEGMPMGMIMIHENAFATDVRTEGPRGRQNLAFPNMEMVDLGHSLGDRHYLNFEIMGTVEKWSFPRGGYPELLQTGEADQNQRPFIDAQHPHSSPLMGLTLSDTISLGHAKDHLRIFFAPRGASTDGPIAFMHRATAFALNPDVPLGHHLGQDVGHISSTVVGASLGLSSTRLEGSFFNGKEPQPEKVDLPMAMPNSWAFRVVQELSPSFVVMASIAEVENPESEVTRLWRTSGSAYTHWDLDGDWQLDNSLIYGQLAGMHSTSPLNSVTEEMAVQVHGHSAWTRLEFLQRTSDDLAIPAIKANDPNWVSAITLGLTQRLWRQEHWALNIGVSVTRDFVPELFRAAYGGDPWTEKVFLQGTGFKMSDWQVQN